MAYRIYCNFGIFSQDLVFAGGTAPLRFYGSGRRVSLISGMMVLLGVYETFIGGKPEDGGPSP
jgi:hypothetical protein